MLPRGCTSTPDCANHADVNLILSGSTGTYDDPDSLLFSGDGKTGRHLKLTTLAELSRDKVRAWLDTAADVARRRNPS